MANKGELNMKKILATLVLLFALTGTQANAMGLFYTNATYPVTATGTKVQDLSKLKKGEASTTNVLFIVEVGDASIDTAAKNAGITKISHIDIQEKTVFIFWRGVKVTVYGE